MLFFTLRSVLLHSNGMLLHDCDYFLSTWSMEAQLVGARAGCCMAFLSRLMVRVSRLGKLIFHPCSVAELSPDLSGKDVALNCPSDNHQNGIGLVYFRVVSRYTIQWNVWCISNRNWLTPFF